MEMAAASRLHLIINNSLFVDTGKYPSVQLDARPALPPQAIRAQRDGAAAGGTFVANLAPAVHDARTGSRRMTAGAAAVGGVRRLKGRDGACEQNCHEKDTHVAPHLPGEPRLKNQLRAFSSEVDTGSREENASKRKSRAPF
jgi:hypothetical protein